MQKLLLSSSIISPLSSIALKAWIMLTIFSMTTVSCSSQNGLAGTYYSEGYHYEGEVYGAGERCYKLHKDGTYGAYKNCQDSLPGMALGLWEVRNDSLIFYAPKSDMTNVETMKKTQKIIQDFLKGIINKDDYYTEDHPDLRAVIERNGASCTLVFRRERFTKQ